MVMRRSRDLGLVTIASTEDQHKLIPLFSFRINLIIFLLNKYGGLGDQYFYGPPVVPVFKIMNYHFILIIGS